MATTTFSAIRSTANTQIEALTPTSQSRLKFERHEANTDFRDWAEDNPTSATRRFYVANVFDYDDVQISNSDEVLEPGRMEVVVAYQNDYRFGDNADLEDVIEEDRTDIDAVIGINATAYTDACTYQPDFSIERAGDVTFLVMTYTFIHYRSV